MPLPQTITPGYTDKEAIERLLWTALHTHNLRTGHQARRWLFVLAGRLHQVEARFPAVLAGPAYEATRYAFKRAEEIAREFRAPNIPMHLRAMREIQRRPYDRWEIASWWSGSAQVSHVRKASR